MSSIAVDKLPNSPSYGKSQDYSFAERKSYFKYTHLSENCLDHDNFIVCEEMRAFCEYEQVVIELICSACLLGI